MRKIFLLLLSIAIFNNVFSGTDNIAIKASVKASSDQDGFEARNVIDGIVRVMDIGEWRSKSEQTFWGYIDYPWIELKWEQPQLVERIILYDRPSDKSHAAGVRLVFSDGSKLMSHSVSNNGAPHVIDFEPREVEWIRVEVCDADGIHIGFSEIEVYPAVDKRSYVEKVDPYVETSRGRYFFFVTGSTPFGMISSAPLTRNKNQYGGGYNYNSQEILGFPQIHDWMNTGLVIMPTTGIVSTKDGEQGWKSNFSHAGEIVQPGYHRLFLENYNTWVEQSSTDRVSIYRFTYCDDNERADVLLNLTGYVSTATMVKPVVEKYSNTEVVGSFYTVGRLWGGPDSVKVYFAVSFDKPMKSMDSWDDQLESRNVTTFSGVSKSTPMTDGMSYHLAPSGGVKALFSVKKGEQLQVKAAISYVSIENARENMKNDCDHWDFNKVRHDSRNIWNEYLGRIDVSGGSRMQQVKFYTDLWHVLLGRHKIDDYNGEYPDYTNGIRQGNHTVDAHFRKRILPKGSDGNVLFHMYNSDAFWLTQWNLNVLWGLAWPEVLDDFAACLVQYSLNGGLLPRGPNLGGYSYIMTSCPATSLIACAYQKGQLTKIDPKIAYRQIIKNHTDGMLGSKDEIEFYEKHGHFKNDAGVSIEASFQDWALSQMAAKMGHNKDASYYAKRSQGWKSLYHPTLKLLMPKNEKGEWMHDDPFSGWGWIEANAWQGSWGISHDLSKLAELMGGVDTLNEKLNFSFEQAKNEDFVYGYGAGYVSYANQPGCSNAHVFNRTGRPDLAQYWVRRVNEQAYGKATPDLGYGGHDEDQGQMGGVSALMSIGLFGVTGTAEVDPVYDITSPVFDEITIKLSPNYNTGKEFRIVTHNNSDQNYIIKNMMLNGTNHDKTLLKHTDFSKGGKLELWLDNK